MKKYNNITTTVDNITFDSKLEASRYIELKKLEKEGVIKDLVLQPKFTLIPKFSKNNKTFRRCEYIADFKYYHIKNKQLIIEDTKGFKTDTYKIKKKLFEYNNKNLSIDEIKSKKGDKTNV